MKLANRVLLLVISLSIILPAAVFMFLPMPKNLTDVGPEEYRIAASTVVLFAWLHIGSVILFLTGLEGFRQELRRAYKAVCAGLGLYGISLLQFPVLAALNLWQSAWSLNGGKAIPLLIANLAIFSGLRIFAHSLNVGGWRTSFKTLLIIPLIALPAGMLVPSAKRIEFVTNVLCALLAFCLIPIALRIHKVAGAAYVKSLRWLWIVLAINAVAQILPSFIILFQIPEGAFITLPFAIAGILSVVAGYSFNKIGESFTADEPASDTQAKAVDELVYLASLASNPQAIDPILDDLRMVTARAQPGAPLSDADQQVLLGVHHRLVTYLVEQDPLHVFDKPLLERKIQRRFPKRDPNEAVFWRGLQGAPVVPASPAGQQVQPV